MRYVSQWQERLGWRLYPQKHLDWPDAKGFRDGIACNTVCEISFLDRLRVLISGKLTVSTRTMTENLIGNQSPTASGININPPSWLSRKEAK